jgi:hypothetical protein
VCVCVCACVCVCVCVCVCIRCVANEKKREIVDQKENDVCSSV